MFGQEHTAEDAPSTRPCPSCGRVNSTDTLVCPGCEHRLDTNPPSGPQIVVPREQEIVDALLVRPGLRIWGAVGWLLALLLIVLLAEALVGFVFGFVLAAQMDTQGVAQYRSFFILTGCALCSVVAAVLGWLKLGFRAKHKLAIRATSAFHLLLVVLLVPPLIVITGEISNRTGQAIDAAFASHEQAGSSLQPGSMRPAATSAYGSWFDEVNELLARQPWIVVLLLACLLPGVGEEIFFRGFLGRGLVARYGAVWGTLATSLLFALMHGDPVQVCCTFVLGVVLHLVYLCTKSLWGPILLHVLNNFLVFSQYKLTLEGVIDFGTPDGIVPVPLPLFLAASAAAVALGVVLFRTRTGWVMADGQEWSPGYVSAEMPPAGAAAVPRYRRPALRTVLISAGVYVAFAVAFAHAVSVWFDPNNAWAYTRRGEAHMEKQEYDLAIATYNEAVRLDPKLAWAYRGRAEAYRMIAAYAKALADCNQAIRLDPGFAVAYADRAETYRLMEDRNRAMADCNRAIQLEEQLAWAYTVRGSVHCDDGRYGQAIADWKHAIRLDPTHAWTYDSLAWIHAASEDSKYRNGTKAVEYATKACELTDWTEPFFLSTLAQAHAEFGQFGQAVRWQKKALDLAPAERKAEFQLQLESLLSRQRGEDFPDLPDDSDETPP